jgi:chaperone modulatory protein CbpM
MSKFDKKIITVVEVARVTGLDLHVLDQFIEREWVCPQALDCFDEEDIARINLIQELKESFGVNDEAVSLILHLMDQLYSLRAQLRSQGE